MSSFLELGDDHSAELEKLKGVLLRGLGHVFAFRRCTDCHKRVFWRSWQGHEIQKILVISRRVQLETHLYQRAGDLVPAATPCVKRSYHLPLKVERRHGAINFVHYLDG